MFYCTEVILNLLVFRVPEIPEAEEPAGDDALKLLPKITTPDPPF
jgi:hypothetical protein